MWFFGFADLKKFKNPVLVIPRPLKILNKIEICEKSKIGLRELKFGMHEFDNGWHNVVKSF